MDLTTLSTNFSQAFGTTSTHTYFAPGRINLIGEHTDYNGGHVFPCAISLGTYAAVAPNDSNAFRLISGNFPDNGMVTLPLATLDSPKEDRWTDYFKGMAIQLLHRGAKYAHGLDIYIWGNLPNGAGLSSSASIELLAGTILTSEFGLTETTLDLVKLGQKTENEFVGVNSGIMDQFAVGMGQPNTALLLDTNTLDYEAVPLDLGDNVIVIMNTNKRRGLVDSKYNERRSECEEALRRLQTKLTINSLGDLDADTFDEYSYLIYDGTLIRRARHAVLENQRTLLAAKQLKVGQLAAFGRLVSASGVSLAFDYEVTGPELDTLVETAVKQPGVLGARMTGAGFGGCAIALVQKDAVTDFTVAVGKAYEDTIGYKADFYIAEIAGGPQQLN